MDNTPNSSLRHQLYEDIFGLLTGTLLISLGIVMFNQSGLLTGGTAGFSFLIHYSTKSLVGSSFWLSFGAVFFLINLPFYFFAYKKMGWRFALKTFSGVALVSLFTKIHPEFIQIGSAAPLYVSVMGGLLMGVGFIVLFRHQASLGGVNILALYLQDHHGIRAGKTQLYIDISVVLASIFVVDASLIFTSIVGALTMNLCIIVNHRPGRYISS